MLITVTDLTVDCVASGVCKLALFLHRADLAIPSPVLQRRQCTFRRSVVRVLGSVFDLKQAAVPAVSPAIFESYGELFALL